MEDYNKIIESLSVRFSKAKNIHILQPLTIENYYDVENTALIVIKGEVKFGKDREILKENEVLFIPGGKMVPVSYGSGTPISLSNDDFINDKEKYFKQHKNNEEHPDLENFSFVNFGAKVFDSVNFFASLDIPPFAIRSNAKINSLINEIIRENDSSLPGKERVVKIITEHLAVELIRYILDNGLFVEQLATNSTYFKDPRLIDIFGYIKENLKQDLSNKVLV